MGTESWRFHHLSLQETVSPLPTPPSPVKLRHLPLFLPCRSWIAIISLKLGFLPPTLSLSSLSSLICRNACLILLLPLPTNSPCIRTPWCMGKADSSDQGAASLLSPHLGSAQCASCFAGLPGVLRRHCVAWACCPTLTLCLESPLWLRLRGQFGAVWPRCRCLLWEASAAGAPLCFQSTLDFWIPSSESSAAELLLSRTRH